MLGLLQRYIWWKEWLCLCVGKMYSPYFLYFDTLCTPLQTWPLHYLWILLVIYALIPYDRYIYHQFKPMKKLKKAKQKTPTKSTPSPRNRAIFSVTFINSIIQGSTWNCMPGLIEKINNKEWNVINAKPYTRIITLLLLVFCKIQWTKLSYISYCTWNITIVN